MSERMKLPNRRPATTFTVTHDQQRYFVTIGHLDTTPVEVFVQAEQTSSTIEAVARDAAIILSFALQFGVSAELMRVAVTREEDGRPASLIGATLDAMLAHFPPQPSDPTDAPERTPSPVSPSAAEAVA